jgi:hypothetical protein
MIERLSARARQEHGHVGDPRPHALPRAAKVGEHLRRIHRRFRDQPVARRHVVLHRLGERLRIRQVAYAHPPARDLVFVGRADSA